jgi:hypothetical protein
VHPFKRDTGRCEIHNRDRENNSSTVKHVHETKLSHEHTLKFKNKIKTGVRSGLDRRV